LGREGSAPVACEIGIDQAAPSSSIAVPAAAAPAAASIEAEGATALQTERRVARTTPITSEGALATGSSTISAGGNDCGQHDGSTQQQRQAATTANSIGHFGISVTPRSSCAPAALGTVSIPEKQNIYIVTTVRSEEKIRALGISLF
jgi:hypothetical protein